MSQPFQVERTTVYQLEPDGFSYGLPRMRNRLWAQVYGHHSTTTQKDREVTARLFSAAPELLSALQTVMNIYGRHITDEVVLNVVNSAIAKAKGEETK